MTMTQMSAMSALPTAAATPGVATPRYAAPTSPQALAARLGVPIEAICKLDSNESPFGAPPGARAALARLLDGAGAQPGLGRYPDAGATALRAALARFTGVEAERIVVGNGSDELITLLTELYLTPDDEAVICAPTFSLYALATGWRGARVVDAGLDDGFAITPDRLARAITPQTRMLFLCAPNNPTGTALARETLDAALALVEAARGDRDPALVIVDEAYYEVGALAGDPGAWTAAPLVATHANLVVLRTFSKLFGLAGLRVGYALCAVELAERLRERKQPYNVNIAGQVAALAALDEGEWLSAQAQTLARERERLMQALQGFDGLRVHPSVANFLLVEFDGEQGQARRDALWEALMGRGILVRRLAGERLATCLRISVGAPEENTRLLEALRALL